MKLLDVLNAPWAIVPHTLETIQALCMARAGGERVDIPALEAKMGRPLANERMPLAIVDGVAVLALDGVLAKRMNLMVQVSGGTSTEIAAQDLQRALDSPQVHSIVLGIESSGGTVDGTMALAGAVRAGRVRKPVVTVASGVMASAAYWIGAAAGPGHVFIADATTQVGSIGVVARHVDISGAEAQRGVKTTEITAGRFKRNASTYQPLDATGRATIQEQVDYVYSLFVEDVARDRGVSTARVLERMADGRMFTGQQAITAGLVDGFLTVEQALARLSRAHATKTPFAAAAPRITKEPTMALNYSNGELQSFYARSPELQAQYPSSAAFISAMEAEDDRDSYHEPISKGEQARQATKLAAQEGISFVDAFKKLGFRYGAA